MSLHAPPPPPDFLMAPLESIVQGMTMAAFAVPALAILLVLALTLRQAARTVRGEAQTFALHGRDTGTGALRSFGMAPAAQAPRGHGRALWLP